MVRLRARPEFRQRLEKSRPRARRPACMKERKARERERENKARVTGGTRGLAHSHILRSSPLIGSHARTMPPRFPVHQLTSEPAMTTAVREAKSMYVLCVLVCVCVCESGRR